MYLFSELFLNSIEEMETVLVSRGGSGVLADGALRSGRENLGPREHGGLGLGKEKGVPGR